jgi:hypothetical protein
MSQAEESEMSTFTAMADAWIRERRATDPVVLLRKIPPDDPAGWKPEFETWVSAHCVFRDGCWGAIGCLHVAFCEWAEKESVPCSRQCFEWLLRDEGFQLADGLVYGLILKEDWEQSLPFRALRTHARERGMRDE